MAAEAPHQFYNQLSATAEGILTTLSDDMRISGNLVGQPQYMVILAGEHIIQDPTQAMFALRQPKSHQGSALVNETGAFCWNELLTTDAAAAEKFYTALQLDGGDGSGRADAPIRLSRTASAWQRHVADHH